nr:unnamed protein product [Spirometra erinaceieuropaei]
MGEMPSSDTSSGSWSESDTDDSMSSTSMANECSSSSQGTSEPTDEEVGITAEVEEEDPSPRESLRKWALRRVVVPYDSDRSTVYVNDSSSTSESLHVPTYEDGQSTPNVPEKESGVREA